MTKDSRSARLDTCALNLMPAEFAAMGKERIDAFTNAQAALLDKFQESNRQWIERMQQEANLASEFTAKVSMAHSIPDAMIAYQEWASRKFEMMAKDGMHLAADAQKFVRTGINLLSNGWLSNGSGMST